MAEICTAFGLSMAKLGTPGGHWAAEFGTSFGPRTAESLGS